ncbi:MAG: hypothetical protein HWE27_14050 [Gammaproteobacteria bacterium]|nr:hypothetical protein [Gammaproteobacteria bacterium]
MQMKFDIFGRKFMEIVRLNNKWAAYYIGSNGVKRAADGIQIPSDLDVDEIQDYLADLFHEWATPNNNEVRAL